MIITTVGGDTTVVKWLNNITNINDEYGEITAKKNNRYLNPIINTVTMESVKTWQSA